MQDRAIPLRSMDVIDAGSGNEVNQFNTIGSTGQFQTQVPVQNSKVVSIFKDEVLEKLVMQKLEENAAPKVAAKSEVEVFFTKDKDLLRQYYDLRHHAYNRENGWQDYDGSENEFDHKARILVVTRDNVVVGGARLMFSDECECLSNDVLGEDLSHLSIIQKYDKRENIIFSEVSAFVVAKNERDRSISKRIIESSLRASQEHGCQYICGVGVAVVCRDYRRIFKELGYHLEIVLGRPRQESETYNLVRTFPIHVRIS